MPNSVVRQTVQTGLRPKTSKVTQFKVRPPIGSDTVASVTYDSHGDVLKVSQIRGDIGRKRPVKDA